MLRHRQATLVEGWHDYKRPVALQSRIPQPHQAAGTPGSHNIVPQNLYNIQYSNTAVYTTTAVVYCYMLHVIRVYGVHFILGKRGA